MNAFTRATLQHRSAVREGIRIVKQVVAEHARPTGFTTSELFRLTLKVPPTAEFQEWDIPTAPATTESAGSYTRKLAPRPSHPTHPIKSISFLKRAVLPHLDTNVVHKVKATRLKYPPPSEKRKGKPDAPPTEVSVYVWQPVDKSKLPKPKVPQKPVPKYGAEVGVGEDWLHLNKRRRRARAGKVRRDVVKMTNFRNEKPDAEKRAKLAKARQLALDAKLKEIFEKRRELKKMNVKVSNIDKQLALKKEKERRISHQMLLRRHAQEKGKAKPLHSVSLSSSRGSQSSVGATL